MLELTRPRATPPTGPCASTISRLAFCRVPTSCSPAQVDVAALNWSSDPAELVAAHGTFQVLLGADLIYSSGCVTVLARAVRALLRPSGGTLLLCSPSGRHGLRQFTAVPRCAKHRPVGRLANPCPPDACPPPHRGARRRSRQKAYGARRRCSRRSSCATRRARARMPRWSRTRFCFCGPCCRPRIRLAILSRRLVCSHMVKGENLGEQCHFGATAIARLRNAGLF